MSFHCETRSAAKALLYVGAALAIGIALNLIALAPALSKPAHKKFTARRHLSLLPVNAAAGYLPSPPNPRVIGGRPPSCPARYCGCDLALNIHGRDDRSLYPAAAWYRFMRDVPFPGQVAIRPDGHHVIKLIMHYGGDMWLVRDPNSGGGLTREHMRDISGWTVVNPWMDTSRSARLSARGKGG